MGNAPPCLKEPIRQLEKSFMIDHQEHRPLANLLYKSIGFLRSSGKPLSHPSTGVYHGLIEKDNDGKVHYWFKMLSIFLDETQSELSHEFKTSWRKATLQPSGSIQIKKTKYPGEKHKKHRIIFIFNEMGTKRQKEWMLWFGSKTQDLKAMTETSKKMEMVAETAAMLYPDQNVADSNVDLLKNQDGFFKLKSPCSFSGQNIDRIWTSRVQAKNATMYKQYVNKRKEEKERIKKERKEEKKRIKKDLQKLDELNKSGHFRDYH